MKTNKRKKKNIVRLEKLITLQFNFKKLPGGKSFIQMVHVTESMSSRHQAKLSNSSYDHNHKHKKVMNLFWGQ